MSRRESISPWVGVTGSDTVDALRPRMLVLDRRQFLRLAAATGLAVTASDGLARMAFAQGASPSEAAATDPVVELAASLGHDPEAIFRWIQQEIRYEPYQGILRGARGTLLARTGNSADQSVLLADLLAASSVPVRYVTGSLDTTAIDALMGSTLVDAETARQRVQQAVLSEADIAAGIHPDIPAADETANSQFRVPSSKEFEQIIALTEADQQALGRVATDQLRSAVAQLQAALASASVTLPTGVSTMPELERDAHVWVQANIGPDWLDLDPSIPGTTPGSVVGSPDTTLESLPTHMRHRIGFKVVAESFAGSALTQDVILDWSADSDALTYETIVLAFFRPEGASDVNFLQGGLSDGTLYNPVLLVGGDAFVALRSISIGGGGGGGGGLLGGDPFGGGGGEGIVDGETAAAWLEVWVTSPGSEPMVARRAIFDRIGQTMRDSGGVDPYAIPPAELVDLGPGHEAEYLPCQAVYAFAATGSTMNVKALLERTDYRGPGVMSLLAAGWQATFDQLLSELVDVTGCLPFVAGPNVTAWMVKPMVSGSIHSMDIWHRNLGTVELSDRTPDVAPALLAGVLGHVAERISAGDGLPSGERFGPSPVSVGSLFQMAADQGVPLRALSGSIPPDMSLDSEVAATIDAALGAGSIVVVPERALDIGGTPRLGWWVVDPATGRTVDRLDTGGGQVEVVTFRTPFEMLVARAVSEGNVVLLRFAVAAALADGRAPHALAVLRNAVRTFF